MYTVVDQQCLSEWFKQISKHYFALNKASPYHTTVLNLFVELSSTDE